MGGFGLGWNAYHRQTSVSHALAEQVVANLETMIEARTEVFMAKHNVRSKRAKEHITRTLDVLDRAICEHVNYSIARSAVLETPEIQAGQLLMIADRPSLKPDWWRVVCAGCLAVKDIDSYGHEAAVRAAKDTGWIAGDQFFCKRCQGREDENDDDSDA